MVPAAWYYVLAAEEFLFLSFLLSLCLSDALPLRELLYITWQPSVCSGCTAAAVATNQTGDETEAGEEE